MVTVSKDKSAEWGVRDFFQAILSAFFYLAGHFSWGFNGLEVNWVDRGFVLVKSNLFCDFQGGVFVTFPAKFSLTLKN